MEKRVQLSSNFALEKEDRISKLPDDILVRILRILKVKEATRTSVLSSRWRHLRKITGRLDFDYLLVRDMNCGVVEMSPSESSLVSSRPWKKESALEVERLRFVNLVNQVLKSSKGAIINEFRVCFDIHHEKSFKCDIDNWINFALQKGVEKLELDFIRYECDPFRYYTITTQFLRNHSLDSITALRLKCVAVTSEVVEYILFNCPCLEMLSLSFSIALRHLKVSGKSLNLKYLEIMRCYNLGSIEISETKLVSFTCFGSPTMSISIYNVPYLVEASLAGFYAGFCIENFCQFSFVSQLEKLVLDLRNEKFEGFQEFPMLRNLRRLELMLNANSIDSILHCISLLNVSPSLQRFSVKFRNYFFGLKDDERQRIAKVRKESCPHQCLKVVELVDFAGCPIEVEIALFLLEKAVSLKKLIIHTCSTYVDEWGRRCYNLETNSFAKQLQTSLPLGAELETL